MFKHNRLLTRLPDMESQAYNGANEGDFVMQSLRRLLNVLVATVAASLAAPGSAQVPPPETQRTFFQIATGPVSGTYMRVGETIAYVVSNPPGVARCEVVGRCGPFGLIATSRSSSGSVANALAVDARRVSSAIIQADIAQAAVVGRGPFVANGELKNLRAIARLHDETLHLVVSSRSRIRRLGDLVSRRVGIDSVKAATNFTVRSVLSAARISPMHLRLSFQTPEQAALDLANGKIDAFFVIGAVPIRAVDNLIRRKQARLVGIDARVVAAMTRANPMLTKVDLPADSYRGSRPVTTIGVASLWVVHKSLSGDLVRGVLRALWNPLNRSELARLGTLAQTMKVQRAAENLPVPLHDGAQRFYAEAGR